MYEVIPIIRIGLLNFNKLIRIIMTTNYHILNKYCNRKMIYQTFPLIFNSIVYNDIEYNFVSVTLGIKQILSSDLNQQIISLFIKILIKKYNLMWNVKILIGC